MFSALKKLAGKNEPPPAAVPGSVQAMSSQLQRKFARGIQYNSEFYRDFCHVSSCFSLLAVTLFFSHRNGYSKNLKDKPGR